MSASLPTVGVIGLGAMGGGMAQVLLAAGFTVFGCDPATVARRRFAAAGGKVCSSSSALAAVCDVIIVMTVNVEQATQALCGDDGALAAARPDTLFMLSLTMAPAPARGLAKKIEAAGCLPLDAPVTGGAVGARSGKLVFMLGGSDAAAARARPIIDALGKKSYHFGADAGAGATAKMINQHVAGCHLAVAAEALAFAAAAGLPSSQMFNLLAAGAGQSWMMDDRAPRMFEESPPSQSAVDIFVKDLGIVLDGARTINRPLPVARACHDVFHAAAAAGYGKRDDSALYHYIAAAGKEENNHGK